VVRDLIGEVTRLRSENEKLAGAFARLKVEHEAVKDELCAAEASAAASAVQAFGSG
jgi:hypothetical protein